MHPRNWKQIEHYFGVGEIVAGRALAVVLRVRRTARVLLGKSGRVWRSLDGSEPVLQIRLIGNGGQEETVRQ